MCWVCADFQKGIRTLLSCCARWRVAGVSAGLKTVIVQRAASFPHAYVSQAICYMCQQILHPTGILPSGKSRWSDKNMLHPKQKIYLCSGRWGRNYSKNICWQALEKKSAWIKPLNLWWFSASCALCSVELCLKHCYVLLTNTSMLPNTIPRYICWE